MQKQITSSSIKTQRFLMLFVNQSTYKHHKVVLWLQNVLTKFYDNVFENYYRSNKIKVDVTIL